MSLLQLAVPLLSNGRPADLIAVEEQMVRPPLVRCVLVRCVHA